MTDLSTPAPVSIRARSMLLAAEVSLTALTCAAGVGLLRLFADASFVPQVVVSAAVAHTLAAWCRRRGLGVGTTSLLAAVGVVFVTTWLVLSDTTVFGIPTGETISTFWRELGDAWTLFGDVKAPAPTVPGFVLAATVGVWGLALLADTAAFRAAGLVEAMVPASTLFVFGAALGAPRYRVPVTALYLGALLAFWLTARAHRQLSSPTWMARDESTGVRAMMRTGLAIGAVGVVAAVLLGPNLPGADAEALIPWRNSDRDSGGSRVTVSPLVDIRTRIVDQAATEVFQVESPVRSYWRLTALETFDGRIWSSSRKYRSARGTLDSAAPDDELPIEVVEQEFNITHLDSIWLPAAFRPVGIDDIEARYDDESSSLLTEASNAIGARYVVQSALPRVDAAQLASAGSLVPDEIAATYLRLPRDFPQSVRDLATGVVAGAATPYEAAKRLQDFFRTGEFTYDLAVPPGHSADALEQFLFQTRRGYCEQFAGAYAAMARAVGLPARIGVGFTTGELGPDGAYTVRGYHGHAWPEVHLAGYGWLPFEPTPGRGIPGGEPYTGVPESQATPGDPTTATTLATTTTLAPATPAPGETTLPSFDIGDSGAGGDLPDGAPSPWPRRLLVTLLVLVLVPLLWAGAVTLFTLLRRWRRRAAAQTPGERVAVAWEEVGEALARTGVPPRRSETPAEYAERAARVTELDRELLAELALLTTESRYAPPDAISIDDDAAASALLTAREVERTVAKQLDRKTKVRSAFDPRVPAGR